MFRHRFRAAHTSKTNIDVAEQLAEIIRGVVAPFACGGSVDIKQIGDCDRVTIRVCSSGTRTVVSSPDTPVKPEGVSYSWDWQAEACKAQVEQLSSLTKDMPQAAFGHGRETKLDRSVRDALQLQADAFEIDFPQLVLDQIISDVLNKLNIETGIVAERYSLNVYRENGKFLKHKDTPRGDDMVGTLVLCLPSYYTGGAMTVCQGMKEHVFFDGGSRGYYMGTGIKEAVPKPSHVQWCAFFADVDHEIRKVTGGIRATVAYLLRRKDNKSAATCIPRPLSQPEQYVRLANVLTDAMKRDDFMRDGGKLGFPCFHLYTNGEVFPGDADARSVLTEQQVARLKGRDAVIGRSAVAACLAVSLVPFLGHDYTGDDERGEYKLARFPNSQRMPRRMSDDTIEYHFKTEEERENDEIDDVVWVLDAHNGVCRDAGETEWNADGYFGNEASGISFYIRAALYAHIPPFADRQQLWKKGSEVREADLGSIPEDHVEMEPQPEECGVGDYESPSEEFDDDSDPFGFGSESDGYGYGSESDVSGYGGKLGMGDPLVLRLAAEYARLTGRSSNHFGRPRATKPKAKATVKAPTTTPKLRAKAKGHSTAPSAEKKAKAKAMGKRRVARSNTQAEVKQNATGKATSSSSSGLPNKRQRQ